jgi:quinol monooxygenase YgiN
MSAQIKNLAHNNKALAISQCRAAHAGGKLARAAHKTSQLIDLQSCILIYKYNNAGSSLDHQVAPAVKRLPITLNLKKEKIMVSKGLLVRLEVQPGRDEEVELFLQSAQSLVKQEPGTTAWFGLRFGRLEYGIFDVFPGEKDREAHLSGDIARSLLQNADTLFTEGPRLHRLELLAHKLPAAPPAHPDTKALLLTFKAKAEHELQVLQFLRDAQPMVQEEPDTTAWFAFRQDNGEFGLFNTFPDNAARFKHLFGHVPRELTRHAFSLFGSVPDLTMLDIITEKRGQ